MGKGGREGERGQGVKSECLLVNNSWPMLTVSTQNCKKGFKNWGLGYAGQQPRVKNWGPEEWDL